MSIDSKRQTLGQKPQNLQNFGNFVELLLDYADLLHFAGKAIAQQVNT